MASELDAARSQQITSIMHNYDTALERLNAEHDSKINGERKWAVKQLSQLGLSESEIRDVLFRNAIGSR